MADRFDDLAERVQLDCESYLLRGSIDGRKRIIREALIAAHATGKDEADEGLRRGMAQTILLSKLPLPLEIVEETTTLRADLARAEADNKLLREALPTSDEWLDSELALSVYEETTQTSRKPPWDWALRVRSVLARLDAARKGGS